MESIISYFSSIPVEHRTFYLIGGFTFLFMLETGMPLFNFKYHKKKHTLINLFYTFSSIVVNLIGASLILWAASYNSVHQAGILNTLTLPIWAEVVIGLLILDLVGAWLVHWMEHKVKWMWKFHIIHHTDPNVDVTSGLRHHPGENLFRLLFTILAILVTGASLGLVMLYQTISAFFAALTHANINVPKWLDKSLSFIFVTPHFHKIHHHYLLPYTDSNYGNIFSIWDYIFSTTTKLEMVKLKYGIDTHMKIEEHSKIKNLLLIPFQAYRTPVGAKFKE